jgi:ubiquinone/menaquinone biosynthesis C-methylase UbiE
VEHAPLHEAQTVLDVATGTAPAAIQAARRVGDSGSVVGVDISPGILKLAKRNIAAMGLTNIQLHEGNAEQLVFPDESFDGILCSSAIVWFPNIPRTLHEWYRMVRPGGWIDFSCFGGPARQTLLN